MPLQQVIQYIVRNSTPEFQARMADMKQTEYGLLLPDQAQDKLAVAISKMSEEDYTDYLLELVDE
jgi:hypothetical protein